MIKNLNGSKLGRTSAHKRALLRNLATSLFLHEKIQTTQAKAKELVRYAEKLITKARPADLNARRAIKGEIQDEIVYKKMFDVLVPRYQTRTGGYTQIYKTGTRVGDRAEMALVKLVS
ncbi:MAG: 50S ribosomal protein L17 [Elusimicrobia bacterium]|nr:50S ribosomal protein L17 [Elusimicrobiota bacterium]